MKGTIEHFNSFDLCLAFLYGVVSSLICSIFTGVVCGKGNSRIISVAKYTLGDAHYAAKKVSNVISFFTTGFILLVMSLMIVIE